MTPEEVELLRDAGIDLLFNIGALVTASVLYGLYLVIITFGIRALLKRNAWTRSTWILFSFMSVICLIFTANVATQVAFNIGLIRGYFVDNPEKPLINRFQLADDFISGLNLADIWLGGGGGSFLFTFADAVLVWRACALWPCKKIVKVSLLALLFATFGSTVVSATLSTISFDGSSTVPTSSPLGVMLSLSESLSLATNVVATMFIGYKAYDHRQTMETSVGMRSSRSGMILLFMTESGVTFCILQVVTLATAVADNDSVTSLDYAVTIWQQIGLFAAASYPVLILLVIDSHRSISDHTGGSAGDSDFAQGSNAINSELSFAVRPAGTSSSGGGVGGDSLIGSRIDPTASVDHSDEGSIRVVRDLEKGQGLVSRAALSTQREN